MNGPVLNLTIGASRDFQMQANPVNGDAWSSWNTSPFLSSDTLESNVWAGHTQLTSLTPTTTWVDSSAAKFQISFNDSDTTTFSAGRYRIQTKATRSTTPARSWVMLDGWLQLTATPGTEAVLLSYTKLTDLLNYANWLEDLQSDTDETAFAHQQARATNRLIDMLVQQWKPDRIWPQFGNAGAVLQWTVGWPSTPPSYWLRQQLIPLVPGSPIPAKMPARLSTTANLFDPTVSTCLLLYDEVKEIAAKMAIAIICEEQIGKAGGGETYRELGRRFRRESNALYRVRRFELDLNNPQTGYTWFNIDGGATSLR